jgi:hypothetical protein
MKNRIIEALQQYEGTDFVVTDKLIAFIESIQPLNDKNRFVKDTSGMFENLYTDTVSGLDFGILTQGRGKRRRKVWHIYSRDNHSFSHIVPSFKAAKEYLLNNYPTKNQ